jgi:hypothetical protein
MILAVKIAQIKMTQMKKDQIRKIVTKNRAQMTMNKAA